MKAEKMRELVLSGDGIWMKNEQGCLMKAWEEGGRVIVRAYCEGGGRTAIWSYKKDPGSLIIEENEGSLIFELADAFADNVNESECESDKVADREYVAHDFVAVHVASSLAGRIGEKTETCTENAEALAETIENLQ